MGTTTGTTRRALGAAGAAGAIAAAAGALLPGVVVAEPTPAALPPPLVLEVPIAGVAGVPADAAAGLVNLTVTRASAAGFAAVYPCTDDVPGVSNVNFGAATDVANTTIAPLSAEGSVCVVASAVTDVVVDVIGYVPAGSPIDPLDVPRRAVDSRTGLGIGAAGRVPAGATVVFDADAAPGSDGAAGLFINVTAAAPAAAGFASVGPCGIPTESSTLNFGAGRDTANLALTAVADDGTVCVTTSAEIDLIVDVAASVPDGAPDPVLLATAVRAVDSRSGTGTAARPWAAGETRVLSLAGTGLPAADTAFVNVTATRAAGAGFVSLHSCDTTPKGSNLNVTRGVDRANFAMVAIDAGRFCATSSAAVDLVVDVVGASAAASTIVTSDAVRVYDSREVAGRTCRLGVANPAPDTLWVVDLDTGGLVAVVRSAELVSFPLPPFSRLPAVLTPTCDELIVATWIPEGLWVGDNTRVLRVSFDGSITEIGRFRSRSFESIPAIDVLADGTPVWLDNSSGTLDARVVDLTTGATLFEPGDSFRILDILANDVILYEDGLLGPVVDQPNGHLPTDRLFEGGPRGGVSPNQRYVIQPVFLHQVNCPIGSIAVYSKFPETVAEVQVADLFGPTEDALDWQAIWVADGLAVLCADPLFSTAPTRTWLWNIHSTPVELGVNSCILDAR